MKFKEIIEQAGVTDDTKARRVSNVSRKTANVTADEIEDGVTIERLEDIGVPVFKYQTQLTIHGRLPEFSDTARPGGYKSVCQNQNGSVGVRYVAIDGAKKQTIVKASRMATVQDRMREENQHGDRWHASINSKGLVVTKYFAEKADCLAAYREFPRDLFAGSVMAAQGMFGGYYVVADVGAIYERNLFRLIEALWGMQSSADLDRIEQEMERRNEEERRASESRRADIKRQDEATRESVATELAKNHDRLEALPKGEGAFIRATANGPLTVILRKKGPSLCYQCRKGTKTFNPVGPMRRFDADKRAAVEMSVALGFVFSAEAKR
jgi:hypothetical protein